MDATAYDGFFKNVLSLTTEEAARESVEKIERLYRNFERLGDRAGQHHVEVLALTGRNRARWGGKPEVANVYETWLFNH